MGGRTEELERRGARAPPKLEQRPTREDEARRRDANGGDMEEGGSVERLRRRFVTEERRRRSLEPEELERRGQVAPADRSKPSRGRHDEDECTTPDGMAATRGGRSREVEAWLARGGEGVARGAGEGEDGARDETWPR